LGKVRRENGKRRSMGPVLESFVAGVPVLLIHVVVTAAMLVAGLVVYTWITPHRDVALVRAGNVAAAVSLSGAILGLALPLAVCLAVGVNVADIAIWGFLTLVMQLSAFRVADMLIRDLSRRIENDELAPALVLSAIKLAVAAVVAAAVSG